VVVDEWTQRKSCTWFYACISLQVCGSHGIAHERLAIIDPDSGSQPLVSPDGKGGSYIEINRATIAEAW